MSTGDGESTQNKALPTAHAILKESLSFKPCCIFIITLFSMRVIINAGHHRLAHKPYNNAYNAGMNKCK